jgi:hypothetical protein
LAAVETNSLRYKDGVNNKISFQRIAKKLIAKKLNEYVSQYPYIFRIRTCHFLEIVNLASGIYVD